MSVDEEKAAIPSTVARRALFTVTILLMLGQGILTIVLTLFVLSSANEIAGGGIGRDELSRFGSGPRSAIACAWLTPILGWLVGIALLIAQKYRWAWLAPVGAMLFGIALCLYFISTFEYTPPTGG